MATTYDVGDKPTVTATIRDGGGVLADPTTVTVRYLDPSGNEADGGAAFKVSTGVYTWTFPAAFDEPGRWYAKFYAAGSIVAAEEITVSVRRTNFVGA